MRREDYDASLKRLSRAVDAISKYAATFDANKKAGVYSASDIARIGTILRDYNLWVDAINHMRDVVDQWSKDQHETDKVTYSADAVKEKDRYTFQYPDPFDMLAIYFKRFAGWTDPLNPVGLTDHTALTMYMALDDVLNKIVGAIDDLTESISPTLPQGMPAFGGMYFAPPAMWLLPAKSQSGSGAGGPPLVDPLGYVGGGPGPLAINWNIDDGLPTDAGSPQSRVRAIIAAKDMSADPGVAVSSTRVHEDALKTLRSPREQGMRSHGGEGSKDHRRRQFPRGRCQTGRRNEGQGPWR
jgi:hypothetical protein